ncbi:MAG: hypothetical protein ABI639_11420 [Thermoanaerobaculia bacterium]
MIRSILTVLVGLLAGSVVVWVLEFAGHRFYPTPPGVDLENLEALKAYVASAPTAMFLVLLVAWAGGAFVGGGVAALLSPARRGLHALAVGGIQTLFASAQFAMIPHPVWFMVIGLTIFLPFAGLAGLIVGREPDVA